MVLFDLDSKFDILRLHQVLGGRAQVALSAAGIRDTEQRSRREEGVVADSLTRLHVASQELCAKLLCGVELRTACCLFWSSSSWLPSSVPAALP